MPGFYKNVSDADFQTFGLCFRGFLEEELSKTLGHIYFNFSQEHIYTLYLYWIIHIHWIHWILRKYYFVLLVIYCL